MCVRLEWCCDGISIPSSSSLSLSGPQSIKTFMRYCLHKSNALACVCVCVYRLFHIVFVSKTKASSVLQFPSFFLSLSVLFSFFSACDSFSPCSLRLVVYHVFRCRAELFVSLHDLVDRIEIVLLRHGLSPGPNGKHPGFGTDRPQLGSGSVGAQPRHQFEPNIPVTIHAL